MRILKITARILLFLTIVAVAVIITGLAFLRFWPPIGNQPDKDQKELFEKKTENYYNGQFHNENEVSVLTGEGYPESPRKEPETKIVAEEPDILTDPGEDDLTYTWIGHSSFLLQLGKKNILADPVLSDRSSPVSFAGTRRFSELPVVPDDLPGIDVLLLSHDHYDHMDYRTIREAAPKVKLFIVPLGVDSILRGWGIESDRICALDWWESIEIDGTTITLTPSQHYTGRNPLKNNSTFWGGYFMDNGRHKVYYTGDGGYYDVFKRVREKFGSPDLMIAECGQYDPAWADIHMFPEEVVQAAVDTGAGWLVPVHWGTFCICNHAWDDPIIRITESAAQNNVNIATPRIGQTVNYGSINTYKEAWWAAYE